MGTSCRDYWAPGGNDQVAAKIEATKPKIAAVLQGIHQRSPNARVAIVGYPDVLARRGADPTRLHPRSARSPRPGGTRAPDARLTALLHEARVRKCDRGVLEPLAGRTGRAHPEHGADGGFPSAPIPPGGAWRPACSARRHAAGDCWE
jgi:hypothetical protein